MDLTVSKSGYLCSEKQTVFKHSIDNILKCQHNECTGISDGGETSAVYGDNRDDNQSIGLGDNHQGPSHQACVTEVPTGNQ